MAADVKWIKIVTDIFDDEKIRFIETMPNGDTIIVIWFKLLCLCGKCNTGGFLMFTNRLAYTDEMLASIFNRDIKVIQLALSTFENLEMVEIVDNRLYIANWEKHQNIDGLEKIREQNRKRVAKHRELKRLGNVTVTLPVTESNATDIEEDIDKELELDLDIEEEKEVDKKKKETFVSVIESYTDDEVLREALKDFVEMRKKKKGFTTKALKLNLNKLDKLANFEPLKIEIVNQTVANTWASFYPLKNNNKTEKSLPDWYFEKDEPKEKEPTKEDHIESIKAQYEYQMLLEEMGLEKNMETIENLKECYRGLTGNDIEVDIIEWRKKNEV